MKGRQRGVTLLGLIVASFFVAVAALLGIKVIPEYLEHWQLKRVVKKVAMETHADASVRQIRDSFDKQASVHSINSVTGADLEISKHYGQITVSFAYEKRIPLFSNVSLLLAFRGSSKD